MNKRPDISLPKPNQHDDINDIFRIESEFSKLVHNFLRKRGKKNCTKERAPPKKIAR